jgi:hypothetical protein
VAAPTISNGAVGADVAAGAAGRPPVSRARSSRPSRARLSRDRLEVRGGRASPDRQHNRGTATGVRVPVPQCPHPDPPPPPRGRKVEDLVRRREEKANSRGGGGDGVAVEAEVLAPAVRVRRVVRAMARVPADGSREPRNSPE